jgi:AcrR family transcriptional regulator
MDPALDSAIQGAVLQVLKESGYAGLTMDAVAVAARVGKATIYRRWPTKVSLLVSVIDSASDRSLRSPDTGRLRDDLVVLLASLARILAGPGGQASRALLGAIQDEPVLAQAFTQGPLARWSTAFADAFQRAVDRGEVPPTAGNSLAAEAGPAIFVQRWIIRNEGIDEAVAAEVVDDVMMPLIDLAGMRADERPAATSTSRPSDAQNVVRGGDDTGQWPEGGRPPLVS